LSPNNLLIVSHVPHYHYEGGFYAYGPYVKEIEIWCELFPIINIASPVKSQKPPNDALIFKHGNLKIFPQLETGGDTWILKTKQIFLLPILIFSLCRVMFRAESIHVRCPGNIGLIGILLAPIFSNKRIAKYAGQWTEYSNEPFFYRLQKNLLKSKWWSAPVTVYGEWPNQPSHVIPFFTSIMNNSQINRAIENSQSIQFNKILQILFVGRLTKEKNIHILIEALAELKSQNIKFFCRIIGEGPFHETLVKMVDKNQLKNMIEFVGAISQEAVFNKYEESDVLVLASQSEGWPKAISEAMAFGLICVGSNRGLVQNILGENRGILIEPGDPKSLIKVLKEINASKPDYLEVRKKAAQWSQKYSLEALKNSLKELMEKHWQVKLATDRT